MKMLNDFIGLTKRRLRIITVFFLIRLIVLIYYDIYNSFSFNVKKISGKMEEDRNSNKQILSIKLIVRLNSYNYIHDSNKRGEKELYNV